MRPTPDHPLAAKTLNVWRIGSLIETLFFMLLPLAYWALMFVLPELPEWGLYNLIGAIVLYRVLDFVLIQKLQWQRWRYKVYENEVELMHGVFVVRRVIIPMVRVQHVDTRQGPILRYYGLASVTISTAATTHEIPGLEIENADRLRDQIAQLAREADPDE
ncbi:PH domain-containing protein [Salisediminibacterium halotolerans]|uniref:YdbS-like PH domain-containing protein n=1 Tax=Salisediminibacterium halotolerans TaxID=517425 RepID=A0A1H9NYX0_9BACI|nr:PH domain-containing protein [Salisediminibacterium haloalkalitolerans]SER40769.1 hypothetical protein SAMN05444126_10115 [Salisediminibacterium haloalkalitolerans]